MKAGGKPFLRYDTGDGTQTEQEADGEAAEPTAPDVSLELGMSVEVSDGRMGVMEARDARRDEEVGRGRLPRFREGVSALRR